MSAKLLLCDTVYLRVHLFPCGAIVLLAEHVKEKLGDKYKDLRSEENYQAYRETFIPVPPDQIIKDL